MLRGAREKSKNFELLKLCRLRKQVKKRFENNKSKASSGLTSLTEETCKACKETQTVDHTGDSEFS